MHLDYDESGIAAIEAECDQLNRRVTEEVGADVRRLCPVDTGELLGTIEVKHPALLTGHVTVGTQHWDMVEYGGVLGAHTEGPYPPTIRKTDQHSHMDAQPFMRPALYVERALQEVDVATLHPSTELVAIAWLNAAIGATGIGIDLPEDSSTWPDRGFVQVRTVGGTPHVHLPQRQPVVSIDCWSTVTGSQRPPWFRAAQLAELIRAATEASDAARQVVIGGQYRNARVQTVYALTEPRPIPSDVAGYAHTVFEIALTWVEAAT